MKLLLAIFLSSQTLNAPVRPTGGGPSPFYVEEWKHIETRRIEEINSATKIEKKIETLTIQLLKIEKKCKLRNSIDKNHSFMDSYYNLSFKKIRGTILRPKTDYECQLDQKVADCLNDVDLKKSVSLIKKDPSTYKYLSDNFHLDQKSAENILDFFLSPGDDSN